MDHLLPKTAVAPKYEETKTACFMGLLSQLAAKPEVLRVTPLQKSELLNAVGSAVVQSATPSSTPFEGTGLNGSGEVIQVSKCNYSGKTNFIFPTGPTRQRHLLLLECPLSRWWKCGNSLSCTYRAAFACRPAVLKLCISSVVEWQWRRSWYVYVLCKWGTQNSLVVWSQLTKKKYICYITSKQYKVYYSIFNINTIPARLPGYHLYLYG